MHDAKTAAIAATPGPCEARILDLATLRDGRPIAGERARGEQRRPRPTAGLAPEIEALILGLAADCAAIRSDLYRLVGLVATRGER